MPKHTFTSDAVDLVSMQRGWILVRAQLEQAGTYLDAWVTLDRQTDIDQVHDRPIGTRYLTVRGPGSAEVAQHLRQDCDLWSTHEALAALSTATTRDAILTAVYAAALSATDQDAPDVTREFLALASHPDPGTRQSLIIVTGYFHTPSLVTLVEVSPGRRPGRPPPHQPLPPPEGSPRPHRHLSRPHERSQSPCQNPASSTHHRRHEAGCVVRRSRTRPGGGARPLTVDVGWVAPNADGPEP